MKYKFLLFSPWLLKSPVSCLSTIPPYSPTEQAFVGRPVPFLPLICTLTEGRELQDQEE